MNKIISFSLWGTNPKYCVGAIKNAHLARKHFPDWTCRFYLGNSVDDGTRQALSNFCNTELVEMEELGDWRGMYWRFRPASEEDVDVMVSRDCDSRLGPREKEAVDEWLASDRVFHSMRDHPAHGIPILGGMWGARKGAVPNMTVLIDKHITDENRWGVDQDFLTDHIYPLVKDIWFEHDAFYAIDHRSGYKKGFPTPRDRETMFFVGQPFDKDDNPEIKLDQVGHD